MNEKKCKRLTLATMCIATFMAILDTTVVNLGLHAIQNDLHVSLSVLQWVLDVYNLVYAGFILTGGVLGDLFGRRRIFMSGIALFTLGCLTCALAPNSALLLVGRGISGLGAALQLPGALSILTVTFREARERAHAIAIWGGFNGLAMAVGPTLGGLLVDAFGWRSIFYLVVPFGIAALALAWAGVAESANPEGRRIDLPGQISSILALGLLAFAFIEAPALHWSSPVILGCLAGSALSLAVLLKASARPGALLSLSVFRNRAFAAAIADAGMMTFGFYTLLFIFPLFFQAVRGDSALVAGLRLLPWSLTIVMMAPIAGPLLNRVGPRALIGSGMVLFGASLWLLGAVAGKSAYIVVLPLLAAIGLGNGLIFGPIMTVAVSSVGNERSGMSSGLVNVARMVGATLGVAISGSIFGAHVVQAGHDAAKFVTGMHKAFFVAGVDELAGGLLALCLLGRVVGQARDKEPAEMRYDQRCEEGSQAAD
jgi:EmrB/QacA subfamily drug resistance transporter